MSTKGTLTARIIDKAMTQMASLVLSEEPADHAKLMSLAHNIIQRGATRPLAGWSEDKSIGPERAAFLYALMATREQEEGLERLALMAAREQRIRGTPDAASVVIASFLAGPEGFDLFRAKGLSSSIPPEVSLLLKGRLGISLEKFEELGIAERTESVAQLFGYAYSGLLRDDLEAGVIDVDNGQNILNHSRLAGWDIRIKEDKNRCAGGQQVFDILAIEGATPAGVRSALRPDVAFINDKSKTIVVGLAFSGNNSARQSASMHGYLMPLLDATRRKDSPWYGYTVVPFYVHAGTFVPARGAPSGEGEKKNTRGISGEGIETSRALADPERKVSMEQRQALATLELMGVPMQARSPEHVLAFFLSNPIVGGVSTLEHLRHAERTARMAPKAAMNMHVAFLAKQATLATQALARITDAPDTSQIVSNSLKDILGFLDNPERRFGDMSASTFRKHWMPMIEQVKELSRHIKDSYGVSSGQYIGPDLMDLWMHVLTKAKDASKVSLDAMREGRREQLQAIGDESRLAGLIDIRPQPQPQPAPAAARTSKRKP